MEGRKAVVSYPVGASDKVKQDNLKTGLIVIAEELADLCITFAEIDSALDDAATAAEERIEEMEKEEEI